MGISTLAFSQNQRLIRHITPQGDELVEGDILVRPHAAIYSPTGAAILWPNGTIPYAVDPSLPNPQRVQDAVDYWNNNTPLKLVARTSEANYINFIPDSFDAACSSFLGMVGGAQAVRVTSACSSGALIHEIGHAFGLLHEHTRTDRNAYVTVFYENIDKRYRSDFDERPSSTTNAGYYDYGSIMHYPSDGFSRNLGDTIASVPLGIPFGQRTALSAGDIDGVSRLYGFIPSMTTITAVPVGRPVMVDGVSYTTPQSFNWTPGSTHTIGVAATLGTDPRLDFVRWSDGGAIGHAVTASPDVTVFCAEFAVSHSVTSGIDAGSGNVTVTPPSADGFYPEGTPIHVQATPAAGTQFFQWASDFNTYLNLALSGYGRSAPDASVEVTEPSERYMAQFTGAPLTTIDTVPAGRLVTVDGTGYTAPVKFQWTAGSTHTLSASLVQMDGNNTVRYQLLGWDGGADASIAVTAGNTGSTHTAMFNTQFLLSTAVSGPGQIAATPSSIDGFYNAGTSVELKAQPATGNNVLYWLGDPAGGAATQTVVMSEQRIALAVFGTALPFVVVNSADNTGNPVFDNGGFVVAPGELVSLYGTNIGPDPGTVGTISGDLLTTNLSGTRVLFDGVPAPILYVSSGLINVVAPSAVGAASATTLVQIERNGSIRSAIRISADATAPGLFTSDGSGRGQIAALNEDFTINSDSNGAAAGSIMILFATGAGSGDQTVADGQIMGANPVRPKAPVYVRIGKYDAEVLYAGSAATLVNGALQVNIRLPKGILSGTTPIQLIAGKYSSPVGTTIRVK